MQATDPLTVAFVKAHGKDCSHIFLHPWQKTYYLSMFAASGLLLYYRWDYFVMLFSFLAAGAYLAVAFFKAWMVGKGVWASRGEAADAAPVRIPDELLPVYTVLVPLYREAVVLPGLTANLARLDYPMHKLDIKLLLEEDDLETRAAAEAMELPACFELLVVPNSLPKTKPKACNYGLRDARGSFVVIYDAEDRPEPDQLRKVLDAFQNAPADVICMQCRLNFFNPRQNWLTRWFSIEYSTWFDFYLEGLQHVDVPMPLGGTSNHFKTEVLREIGGWDPFNVTEDCDLGIRLYKRRYRTRVVRSTTWEEATSRLGNWVRQRSRWVKGYFQTYFTHMRDPLRTFRGLGLKGFAGFLLIVGGHSLLLVLNLVFWLVAGLYALYLARDLAAGHSLWEVVAGEREAIRYAWKMIYWGEKEQVLLSVLSVCFFVVSCALFLGNLFFILIGLVAVLKRRMPDLLLQALLMPLYWILISIGAWKGFLQLFTKPFYWEKTEHGMDHPPGA